MTIAQTVKYIEDLAPLAYQESYDNAGLCVGNPAEEVAGVLLCVDVSEEVVGEAVARGCNLIISHHPVIFGGLKRITGQTATQRIVQQALTHNIALYAAHTNVDKIRGGVSEKMCEKLQLTHLQILDPQQDSLYKVVTYVPLAHAPKVRQALWDAGAGNAGNYRQCSFAAKGEGTFCAQPAAQPFVGKAGELHHEPETRIEVMVPQHCLQNVVNQLVASHPYEEPAYDLLPLKNLNPAVGLGMVGTLPQTMDKQQFLQHLRQIFGTPVLRYNANSSADFITKVAVCGGSGASLVAPAAHCADAFISADLKYHDLQNTPPHLLTVDVGHYESEKFVLEFFYDIFIKKNTTFAVLVSDYGKNAVGYL
ncbi:GTP cyclohydrolase 1 type 2 [Bacteroidia bacterium]|nr:GTP cyclohydrolase 1 type 2 [Bacteroidia bacterium]